MALQPVVPNCLPSVLFLRKANAARNVTGVKIERTHKAYSRRATWPQAAEKKRRQKAQRAAAKAALMLRQAEEAEARLHPSSLGRFFAACQYMYLPERASGCSNRRVNLATVCAKCAQPAFSLFSTKHTTARFEMELLRVFFFFLSFAPQAERQVAAERAREGAEAELTARDRPHASIPPRPQAEQ